MWRLSLGLEQAGFTPVYVNELNHDAMDSYLCNRIEENPLLNKYKSHDIKELSEKTDIKKLIGDITKDYKIKIKISRSYCRRPPVRDFL